MAKQRPVKNRNEKRKIKKVVQIVVEGTTDKTVIESMIHKNMYQEIKFKTYSKVDGGGYTEFLSYIEKNSAILDVVIIVADLDRAAENLKEKQILQNLIKELEKQNIKNNIFLTYPRIEDWLIQYFSVYQKNLKLYEFLKSSKGDIYLYDKLIQKSGNVDTAIQYYARRENDLFYMKKNYAKVKIEVDNLCKKQSNLYYILNYFEFLNNN